MSACSLLSGTPYESPALRARDPAARSQLCLCAGLPGEYWAVGSLGDGAYVPGAYGRMISDWLKHSKIALLPQHCSIFSDGGMN